MISLRPFYSEDLLEAEQALAMQEYWDDLGSWWANSKVEKKIIMLGRFVMHGGKIDDVLERYRDGVSEDRASRIKPCIFIYLGILMADGHINRHSPLYAELVSLSEKELLLKLTEQLMKCVKETEGTDAAGKRCYNYEIVKI
jgi:hypothetical protein